MLDVARRSGRLLMTSFFPRFDYRYERLQQRFGWIGRNILRLANADVNCGVLEFEDGTIAGSQTSWLYPAQPHDQLQWNAGIQVMGDNGVLEACFDQGGFRSNTEGQGITLLDQTGWAEIHDEPRGAFGAMLRHFMCCLRGSLQYRGTTSEEAIESMRITGLLVEASARGRGGMA